MIIYDYSCSKDWSLDWKKANSNPNSINFKLLKYLNFNINIVAFFFKQLFGVENGISVEIVKS